MSDLVLLVAGTILASFLLYDPGEEVEKPKVSTVVPSTPSEPLPAQAAAPSERPPLSPTPAPLPAVPESPASESPQEMESAASKS